MFAIGRVKMLSECCVRMLGRSDHISHWCQRAVKGAVQVLLIMFAIAVSTRMRQEYTDHHAGKQAKKQEKLAHKRPRKQPDHADQWAEQQWSQRTWNAGWREGWHEPASSSSSGLHYQRQGP